MSDKWHGYRARWNGEDYPANPEPHADGLWMHLIRSGPSEQFERLEDDLYVRRVNASECEAVTFVSTVTTWRTAECQILDERDGQYFLEYAGGSAIEARRLEFERIEPGVWRRWVDQDDVRGTRGHTVLVSQPEDEKQPD